MVSLLVVGVGVEGGIYYILNSDESSYVTTKARLEQYLPSMMYQWYKPGGTIKTAIQNFSSFVGITPAEKESPSSDKPATTEKPSKKNDESILSVFEPGMTMEHWLKVKDDLVVLETPTSALIAKEKALHLASLRAEQAKKTSSKSETKESIATAAGSESDAVSKPSQAPVQKKVVPPVSSDPIEQQVTALRSKIKRLSTSELDEAFPVENPDALRQQAYELETKLNEDLETVLIADLGLLSEEALRRRLVKLILEFKDRSRWEAIRLSNVLEVEGKKMKQKTSELLQKQERLFQELHQMETAKTASETEARVSTQLEKKMEMELKKQEASLKKSYEQVVRSKQEDLLTQFKRKLNDLNGKLNKQRTEDRAAFQSELEKATARFKEAVRKKEDLQESYHFSTAVHAICAQFLDLMEKIKTKKPFLSEVTELKYCGSDDKMLVETLNRIPVQIMKRGLKTDEEFVHEFDHVYGDLSKHVLIKDENPTMLNHFMASVVSRLSFDVLAGKDSPNSQEEILYSARAAIVKEHNLEKGVKLLQTLNEKNKTLADSFILEVLNQRLTEQLLQFVEVHIKKLAKEASQL